MVTTTLPFAGAEVGPVIHTILRVQHIHPIIRRRNTIHSIHVYAFYCCVSRRRGALSDTAIRPSVRPSVCPSPRRAAALGYRHDAGCLSSHVRTADPSADGRRSAVSRTAISGGNISSRRPGAITCYRREGVVCVSVSLLEP